MKLVALCEPRLLVKPYGKAVVWSLPPARRIFRLDRGDVSKLREGTPQPADMTPADARQSNGADGPEVPVKEQVLP